MSLLVQEKTVVVPGEIIADGMDYLPSEGTYRKNDKIYASRLGILSLNGKVLKNIPLSGKYLPKRNDLVIGRVFDILISGWRLDINCPYSAVLNTKEASYGYISKMEDLSQIYQLDDYLVCTIINVTSQNLVDITTKGQGMGKLQGGRIMKVNTHKIPRIIGKKGSMITMIKQATSCQVVVGQNGVVWLKGDPENELIARKAIQLIEDKAHIGGLTAQVKSFLEKETGKPVAEVVVPEGEDELHEQETSAEQPRDESRQERRPEQRRGPSRFRSGGSFNRSRFRRE
ncbi:MAG: exosome complex RNA-binding protein Rrp4 [archaeon]